MKALLHPLRTALNDRDELEGMPNGFVDDASRLNRTRVSEVRSVAGLRGDPEEQLRAHLQYAHARKLPLSIAGTRHTMGGQPRTQQADQQVAAMTRELIEAALAVGGRYYLPYRLHATVEQFYRAYPQAQQFFKLKRRYDPEELFQNELYRKYGAV